MPIAEALLPRRGRPPIPSNPEQAPRIAERIEAAERQLAALIAERPQLALDSVREVEGAAERLAAVATQVDALERQLATLRLALDEAERQDQKMFTQQREALQATQVAAARRHLRARDEAGLRLSAAIENAVSAYRDMILNGRKAMQANPIGGIWPPGSLCGAGEAERATDDELFRLGHRVEAEQIPSFPRRDEHLMQHPRNMVPLAERLAKATEVTIAALMRREPA